MRVVKLPAIWKALLQAFYRGIEANWRCNYDTSFLRWYVFYTWCLLSTSYYCLAVTPFLVVNIYITKSELVSAHN